MSAARFPPGQHLRWTISARVLRPNEEGTQPGYPVETAAGSVAPERGKDKPWPARLETRAHLPRSHLRPGRQRKCRAHLGARTRRGPPAEADNGAVRRI